MKKISITLLTLIMLISFAACSAVQGTADDSGTPVTEQITAEVEAAGGISGADSAGNSAVSPISVDYSNTYLNTSASDTDLNDILLEGDKISYSGTGAVVNGNIITITSSGSYRVSGLLDDGQILVDTVDEDPVFLILAGVDITSLSSAPIYVMNAELVVITLADATDNHLQDGELYILEDSTSDEPDAALFSNDDLVITGSGSLTVDASYKDGIVSQDDLIIDGSIITVSAPNDGIKGRDSLLISDADIRVNAGADGLQSNNDEDPEKGYVAIDSGRIDITSGLDGIQAETRLIVSGGSIIISTGGGSGTSSSNNGGIWGGNGQEGNPNQTLESEKGLKAGVEISITGGTLDIDSADDSIHSNGSIMISGGSFTLASGDDGLHADTSLEINDGEISLLQCYEGLESSLITINGGTLHLISSDDGINVAGGSDGSATNGRQGQNQFSSQGNYHLFINGGYIYLNSGGDGLDSNGSIDMTAGVVIVNGPTNNGNGPLDYMGTFNITGGFLIAVGSSGMAQAPSQTSTQYSLMHNFNSVQSAGTLVHIESSSGEDILTFQPAKEYQSVLISSAGLKAGEVYLVYSGGSTSGEVSDGLYSNGSYQAGIQAASYTLSSVVTTGGAAAGGGPGGGPGGGMPPGGRGRP